MLNCACPNISFPLNEKNSTKLPSTDPYNFQFVHYQHIRTYQMRGDIFSKTCKESSKIDIQTIQSRKMAPFNFYIFCHMIGSPAEKWKVEFTLARVDSRLRDHRDSNVSDFK